MQLQDIYTKVTATLHGKIFDIVSNKHFGAGPECIIIVSRMAGATKQNAQFNQNTI